MYSINDRVRFLMKELGKSQESFGKGIHRSRSEISNIVYDKVLVKDEIITAICDSYGVDRIWLETGAGEPFRPADRNEQIAKVLAHAISGNDTARDRLIRAFSQLPDEMFDQAEKILEEVVTTLQKEKE